MNGEDRGNLYLLTGLIIGIALGIYYAWMISPIQYVDTDPSSLAEEYKDAYRLVIAQAYQANGDLVRARARASLIDADNPGRALAAQAQRMIAANAPAADARAVAALSADLLSNRPDSVQTSLAGQSSTAAPGDPTATLPAGDGATPAAPDPAQPGGDAVRTATPRLPASATPSPTVTLTPLPTYTPSRTPSATPALNAPFSLKNRQEVCDGSVKAGLIVFNVTGPGGEPLAGVKITVAYGDRVETFYTGLAPNISLGYADFATVPGVTYEVKVGDASEAIRNIMLSNCGLKLDFSQEQ